MANSLGTDESVAAATPRRAPERDELLAAVKRIRPVLEECTAEAEQERALPARAVEALHEADLFKLLAPREVGGLAVDPITKTEVLEALAYIDANAAWTVMIGSTVSGLLGCMLPSELVTEVFGTERFPVACSQFNPAAGRGVRCEGGLRVTGQWSFASGIHHSDWALCSIPVFEGEEPAQAAGGEPLLVMALLPIHEVELLDNWHTLGLRGSGSCDFVARDVFVPERRCFEAKSHRGGPVHQMNTLPMEHAALPIGIARRALDEVRELALEKVRLGSSTSLAHRNVFQRELGRMEMAWRSVRALFYELVAEAWEPVRAGQAETQEQDLLLRNAAAYATDVCLEISTTCLRFGGASSLFESHALQRCYRNVSAAGQHLFVTDENYEALGQLRLGLPVEPRLFPGSNAFLGL